LGSPANPNQDLALDDCLYPPHNRGMERPESPDKIADAAVRILRCNDDEAALVRRAVQCPQGLYRVVAAVEGRAYKVLVMGPYGRGKTHAIRCLSDRLVSEGYSGLASVEIDQDGAGTGGSMIRLMVPRDEGSGELKFLSEGQRRREAATTRERLEYALQFEISRAEIEYVRKGLANGVVVESLSSFWTSIRDLVSIEYPDSFDADPRDTSSWRRRAAIYNHAWASTRGVFDMASRKSSVWSTEGPLLGIIVCHAAEDSDSKGDFVRWRPNLGKTLRRTCIESADLSVGFGVNSQDGPDAVYPRPGAGYYAVYDRSKWAYAKSRIVGGEESAFEHLKTGDLASHVLDLYSIRRGRAIQAIADATP